MRTYRSYTEDSIKQAAKDSFSIAGMLNKLNLKPAGGNYKTAHNWIKRYSIDTSHWTGIQWNKGQRLKDWSEYKQVKNLKKHVMDKRGTKCESCQNTHWLGEPIKLELHHIDGNPCNNEESNLQLLCPNCHAYTDNYRGKNVKKSPDSAQKTQCEIEQRYIMRQCSCGVDFLVSKTSKTALKRKFCSVNCALQHNRTRERTTKITWPPVEYLINEVNRIGYSALGRQLGVTDNAIRKRIKNHSK